MAAITAAVCSPCISSFLLGNPKGKCLIPVFLVFYLFFYFFAAPPSMAVCRVGESLLKVGQEANEKRTGKLK